MASGPGREARGPRQRIGHAVFAALPLKQQRLGQRQAPLRIGVDAVGAHRGLGKPGQLPGQLDGSLTRRTRGHDPVRQGWAREGHEQLCFSTSFALKNARKVYVELDLEREYRTVDDLKLGRDIRWLYPELSLARKKKPLITG